jgi:phosphoglycolate phosphatase
MRYKGIIFDLDGTLVDSFPAIHQSLARAMEGMGVSPWDLEQTTRTVGRGVEHLVETAVGREKKDGALKLFKADYRATCLEKTFLFPGVSETLHTLTQSGHVLSVATNKPLAFTHPILEHLEIHDFFACVMGPERVEHPKPHPDMIRAIRNELRLAPDECLYVGDMPLDAETASRAGVNCVLVATGAHPFPALKRQASVPVLQHFTEIVPFLAKP